MAAELGVSKSCLTKWEAAKRHPSGPALRLISVLYFDGGDAIKAALDRVNSGHPYSKSSAIEITAVRVKGEGMALDSGLRSEQLPSDGLAAQRSRLALTQQYVFNLIQSISETITNLPENRQRVRHLRELSAPVAMLTAKLTGLMHVWAKLGFERPDRLGYAHEAPVQPSFAIGVPVRVARPSEAARAGAAVLQPEVGR
jgi:hypothetical protein